MKPTTSEQIDRAFQIGLDVIEGRLATFDPVKCVVVQRRHLQGGFTSEIRRAFEEISISVEVTAGVIDNAVEDWGFNEDAVLDAVYRAVCEADPHEAMAEQAAMEPSDEEALADIEQDHRTSSRINDGAD